jgi:hypothetical protein
MTTQKIKVEEITLQDLVKEAFSIPDGWKEEIYVEDGEVEFSSPMTSNTYSGIDAHTPLPSYRGDIESMRIGDFEEFYERDDGQVEICDNDNQQSDESETFGKGEYYEWAMIVSRDDAIEKISEIIEDSESTLKELLEKIREPKPTHHKNADGSNAGYGTYTPKEGI